MQLRWAAFAALLLLPNLASAQSDWRVTLDTLVYDDTDHVTVVTPRLSVAHRLDEDGGRIGARVLVDVVSAASVDVVSHATSGFTEARTEVGFDLAKAFGDHLPSASYRFSIEPDYESHGGWLAWQSRLGTPDSVLSIGYGLTYDVVGRVDTPWDAFSEELITQRAVLSFTQTLGPETVLRGVYSMQAQLGYLEKPYRFVPLFSASLDATPNADNFDTLRLAARPPESVPDARVGHAVGLRLLQSLDDIEGSLRADYQFYVDDWGLTGHTVELALTGSVTRDFRIVGYSRFYAQTPASFWQRDYRVEEAGVIPRYRSLDRDLSPYEALTGGARVEWTAGEFGGYVDGAVTWTHFEDFLLLENRVALFGLVGLRWTP